MLRVRSNPALSCRLTKAYLLSDTLNTGPAAQDEGVVGRDQDDLIDTLALERIVLLEEGGKVVGVARGL